MFLAAKLNFQVEQNVSSNSQIKNGYQTNGAFWKMEW